MKKLHLSSRQHQASITLAYSLSPRNEKRHRTNRNRRTVEISNENSKPRRGTRARLARVSCNDDDASFEVAWPAPSLWIAAGLAAVHCRSPPERAHCHLPCTSIRSPLRSLRRVLPIHLLTHTCAIASRSTATGVTTSEALMCSIDPFRCSPPGGPPTTDSLQAF